MDNEKMEKSAGEKQGRFIDRYMKAGKPMGCFVLFSIIGMVLLGIGFVMAGPFFIAYGETTLGIVLIVMGLLSGGFFGGIGLILPYYQHKKGITSEQQRVWKTGVLTAKELEAEFGKNLKNTKLASVVGGVVCILVGLIMFLFSEYLIYPLIIAGCGIFFIINGIRAKKTLDSSDNYYIVEDRVIERGIDTRFGVIDAVTTHLPDRVPYLVLERYGKYDINPVQIHKYFLPQEIEQDIELGEDVYVVCSGADNSILYICRAKHRTLSSELLVKIRR